MAYMKYLFDRTVQFIENCIEQSFIPSHCKSYEGGRYERIYVRVSVLPVRLFILFTILQNVSGLAV